MEMSSCVVCGKIFMVSGRPVCPSCRKLIDIVYDKARSYLRDNPNTKLNARELAEAIKEDIALVEILVMEGRFEDKNDIPVESEEERNRKKLLEEFQKNTSKTTSSAKRGPTTYGSDRHGRG